MLAGPCTWRVSGMSAGCQRGMISFPDRLSPARERRGSMASADTLGDGPPQDVGALDWPPAEADVSSAEMTQQPARALIRRRPVTCGADRSVREVARLMCDENVNSMIVRAD